MNFFGSSKQTGPSALDIAKMEGEIVAELLSDTFNRMTKTCFNKCVGAYRESELAVGEMTCTDRCVGKYMQASERVAEVLKKHEEAAKAQAKAQEEMMSNFK